MEKLEKKLKSYFNRYFISTQGKEFKALIRLIKKHIKEEYETPWISVEDSLPKDLETVWISNGQSWTTLGCLVDTPEGYHWAATNGIIYQEDDSIVSECESDDLDVKYWCKLPKVLLK